MSFLRGWKKIPIFKDNNPPTSEIFISIIIALRNEEKNIPQLIESLSNQILDIAHFEVILINDHSTDNTLNLCNSLVHQLQNFTILNLANLSGKKNAILLGAKHAKGQLIVTTDADCTAHTNWLKSILAFYLKYRPKMILGTVLMKSENFFEKIQSLDFYSLMISGAGATGNNKPIMCNGANLAFEKDLLENKIDILNTNFVSGDDVFLLLNLKKKLASEIMFIKSSDAIVCTKAEPTFFQFFNQRKRWASKSKGYKDKDLIFAASFVFLINLTLIFNLIFSFIFNHFWMVFAVQLIVKSIIDYLFLVESSSFFNQRKLLAYFIPTQIFNMFIVPIIAISGVFSSFVWKDRNYAI